MKRKLILTAILFWIDSSCWAGREPEPWDALPQIQDVKFSETAVGFQSVDNRYFVLDRVTQTFQEEEASSFSAHFPPTKSPSEISANRGVGSSVLLRSSDGEVFETRNAYCSEGANLKHQLLLNGKPISDHVQPCQSVSAVEKVGDQLWLGTRTDGEFGAYPAEGIVIQSLLNGELVKKISSSDGLTGDLVRAIRFDPHSKNIWVATNQGFNEISRDFSVTSKQHFYEGFDDKTGRASIFLSTELKTNDPLAELQRRLQVQDPKAFYLAIQGIPSELRQTYRLGESCHGRSLPCTVENAFAPEAFNVLVPFVLNAARSSDEQLSSLALWRLCEFNDPRVAAYLKEKETHGALRHEKFFISTCLSKFDAFGLLESGTAGSRAEDLIAQEKSALEILRRSPKNPYLTDRIETVVRTAKALQDTGNKEGFELINQHFSGSVGSRNDARLFDDLFGRFYIYNELAPTALKGLETLSTSARGCQYFDMRYNARYNTADFSRYDARYADAMLKAIDRTLRLKSGVPLETKESASVSPRSLKIYPASLMTLINDVTTCEGAFRSQLQDSSVKQQFMESYYPHLSPSQKQLADSLMRTK